MNLDGQFSGSNDHISDNKIGDAVKSVRSRAIVHCCNTAYANGKRTFICHSVLGVKYTFISLVFIIISIHVSYIFTIF